MFFLILPILCHRIGVKHPITFYSTKNERKWNSADSDTIINEFLYNTLHESYIGISENEDSPGLYYSSNAIHWIFSNSGNFISIATDNRTGMAFASDGSSVLKSTDGGWSWKEISCGDCGYSCSIEKLGFLNEIGFLYQLSSSIPQRMLFSNDDGNSWGILSFPYSIPMRSFSYGAGALVGLTKGYTTYSKTASETTDFGGIITIPVANLTITPCGDKIQNKKHYLY